MLKFTFSLTVCLLSICVNAQIFGTKTIGSTGDYTTLTAAFAAINTLGISDNVLLEMQSNYNPASETYPIAPGILTGASTTKTVTVRPANGVSNILIAPSTAQAFNLNGTKYLIIDGRAGGIGNGVLTIRSTSSTGHVFRFINDAAYNTINHITCESNNSNFNGVIIFSTTTGTIGNSFNTISNCNVRNRSDVAGNPAVLIYSAGTAGKVNESNTITGNNLFNANQRGIYLVASGLGNNWVIANNSFYHTGGSVSSTYYGLHISAGNGFTISGNYIGGTAPNAGGAAFENTGVVTNSFQFIGMALFFGNGAVNLVQNNVIKNHILTSNGSTYGGGIGVFSGTCDLIGNSIENISSSHAGQFISMQYTGSGIIKNNTIKGISKTFASDWYGILAANAPSVIIEGNNISNCTSNTSGNMFGILTEGSLANITHNQINNISATAITPGNFYGIMASGDYPIQVTRNKIFNVGATASSSSISQVTGIHYPGFNGSVQPITIGNNMVTLGLGMAGNAQYKGIHDAGLVGNNLYSFYNSVVIDGTSSGGNKSFAFVKTGAGNEVHRNNIYYNNRTNPSDQNHAIAFEDNTGAISSNHNLLVASAGTMGKWGLSAFDFESYKATALIDTSSYHGTTSDIPTGELFIDRSIGDLRIDSSKAISWYVNGKGIAGSVSGNIANDENGNVRGNTSGTPTDIGAHEFSTTSIPSFAMASGNPSAGVTTTYTFGGRKIGQIIWGNGGVLPTSIEWRYYSGIPSTANVSKINSHENITATGGSGYTYDMKLYYTDAENNNLADGNLALLKQETSSWDFSGSSNNQVDAAGKFMISSGQTFNTISDFTLGVNTPLPIASLNLSGRREANGNRLSWTGVPGQSTNGYEIERSIDGYNFTPFGFEKSTNALQYIFVDTDLRMGKTYYRVTQLAIDGNRKISNVISIDGEKISGLLISSIYPNPASDILNVSIDASIQENVTMMIFDMSGRIMFSKNLLVREGSQTSLIPLAKLKAGMYSLKISGISSRKSSTVSFLKQ